jgi:hypothetical protein
MEVVQTVILHCLWDCWIVLFLLLAVPLRMVLEAVWLAEVILAALRQKTNFGVEALPI